MQYPRIQGRAPTRDFTNQFGGYNHNLQIGTGELYDMQNLSSDDYPALSVRKRRGVYAEPLKPTGMIAKDSLCYTDGTAFVINGYRVELGLDDREKQLVSMGAYVIILPDRKYVNTADLSDFGSIEASFSTSGKVTYSLCDAEGNAMTAKYRQAEEPTGAASNDVWIDTSGTTHSVKTWSSTGMWVTVPTTYIKIENKGIGKPFQQYDGVRLSGMAGTGNAQLSELEGSTTIWAKDDDFIVVIGLLDDTVESTGGITIQRKMPDMDFVIESENRLWGCRYGLQDGAVVNELYASKLGDFRNWECYMGVSTDSYRVSLGSDGQFTGAVTYLGHPLFFKETCMHKVYGSYPAQYQVQTTACRGVQKGSAKSLAIVNETLYYKGVKGVCAYNGSLPGEISGALGETAYRDAVGGGFGNKYFVSMVSDTGRALFVYDTQRRVWHKEDGVDPLCFCAARGEMYLIENTSKKILTVSGSGAPAEETIDWMAESGVLGLDTVDTKYFPRVALRLDMEQGSNLEILIEYDSCGRWEHVCKLRASRLNAITVPIRPRRCDHMRLKLVGHGHVTVYSIAKSVLVSSEQRRREGLHMHALDF